MTTAAGQHRAGQRAGLRARHQVEQSTPPPGASGPVLAAPLLAAQLVVAGLAATAVAQGGYHPAGRYPLLAALPLALALVVARPAMPGQTGRLSALAGGAALALGSWALLRGAVSPDPTSGLPVATLLAAVALLLAVGRRLDHGARALVLQGLLGTGAVVALLGWIGVVWHVDRLAVTLDGVWRAGSTLTYPNAAAALLTLLVLPAAALLTARPGDVRLACLVALLLVGHLGTLSRAGVLSLAVGVVVLTLAVGWPGMTRALLAPGLGAAVAGAGLWGSFLLDAPAGRWTAVLALIAGLGVAAALAPLSVPSGPVAVGGLLAAVIGCLRLLDADVVSARLDGGSSTRLDAHRAALQVVADHPWLGVGPGAGPLELGPVGQPLTVINFVHDEYVQTALNLGVLSLLLLLLLVALLVRTAAVGYRQRARDPLRAGVLAALVAAAVHGGLDFVWHVPVVPLTAVALVAVVLRPATDP